MDRLNMFLAYERKSPEDEKLKDKLCEHLAGIRRFDGVKLWTYDDIPLGDDWKHEINTALQRTDVALLLVSPSFLASEFMHNVVVPSLLASHADNGLIIIPIIMRACRWEEHPWIGGLQPLPRDGTPVAGQKNRDAVLRNIAAELGKLAGKRAKEEKKPPAPGRDAPAMATGNVPSLSPNPAIEIARIKARARIIVTIILALAGMMIVFLATGGTRAIVTLLLVSLGVATGVIAHSAKTATSITASAGAVTGVYKLALEMAVTSLATGSIAGIVSALLFSAVTGLPIPFTPSEPPQEFLKNTLSSLDAVIPGIEESRQDSGQYLEDASRASFLDGSIPPDSALHHLSDASTTCIMKPCKTGFECCGRHRCIKSECQPCVKILDQCSSDDECCESLHCYDGRCLEPCAQDGQQCAHSDECCGRYCIGNVCRDCRKKGQKCSGTYFCCGSLRCVDDECRDCSKEGQRCKSDYECCPNYNCGNGLCR